ncbi:MAG: flagellar biosynthetic protein FliR [Fimbriimonadales bacterium]
MTMDAALMWAFLLVFVRCSAMLLSSPIFGAQSTPVQVRVFTTLAISACLTFAVGPKVGPLPSDAVTMAAGVAQEVAVGLLLGAFCNLVLQAVQMAGSFLDLQMGLSMSQALNPMTGVPVTVVSQFKFLLGIAIFLGMNAHHLMLKAFAASYQTVPSFSLQHLGQIQTGFIDMVSGMSMLALQIAAPVAAVGFVVDASLGIVNKAVPQMQAFMVGMPAKTIMGLLTLSMTLPALATSMQAGVARTFEALHVLTR